ncbi:MAG TPA: hypothetical protein PK156_31375 [Polyangium sp.]|nr:hypothetical protein [Polyangium sp.]
MLASRPVLMNTHWVVEIDAREEIMIVRRTANAYANVGEVRAAFEEVRRIVDGLDRPNFSVFIDMRLAPPRDDPEFERAAIDQPKTLSHGFKRSAVVMRTAIGILHVQRNLSRLGVPIKVFNDEQPAIEYLRGRSEPQSVNVTGPPTKRGL